LLLKFEEKWYSPSVATLATAKTFDKKDQFWFHHPEMQARIAKSEADFAAGRATWTETPEQARAFLDSLKKKSRR
jgi:hypothetical protein